MVGLGWPVGLATSLFCWFAEAKCDNNQRRKRRVVMKQGWRMVCALIVELLAAPKLLTSAQAFIFKVMRRVRRSRISLARLALIWLFGVAFGAPQVFAAP